MVETPETYQLYQNYPNLFNPSTTIEFNLSSSALVKLTVFNVLGEKVKTLVNNYESAGSHSVTWFGKNDRGNQMPSGLYFCVLDCGDFKMQRKMLLVK